MLGDRPGIRRNGLLVFAERLFFPVSSGLGKRGRKYYGQTTILNNGTCNLVKTRVFLDPAPFCSYLFHFT